MESSITSLAQSLLQYKTSSSRYLIGLYGIPGSGKSSLGQSIISRLNELAKSQISILVNMDGFHYYRNELDKFENSENAHRYRGAHFTFNVLKFENLIIELKKSNNQIIYAPSFSHSLKDPIENDIIILPTHRIIILEGLYVALNSPNEWKNVSCLLDERWLINVNRDIARLRVAKRHIKSGICKNMKEALERVDFNDMKNGDFLLVNSLPPTKEIQSIEDENLAKN